MVAKIYNRGNMFTTVLLKILSMLNWQAISIVESSIHHVHKTAFYGLLNLRELQIDSRLLHTPPSLEFIKHSLERLTFVNCPIRPAKDYFSSCPRLRDICMINNNLKAVSWKFYNISRTIKHAELSRNDISSLTPLEGILFSNLTILSLHKNCITVIRGGLLRFPMLRRLDISKNSLVNIGDPSIYNWGKGLPPGEIVRLYLWWNPWHCNGSMDWLIEGIYKKDTGGSYIFYRRCPSRIVISRVHQMFCSSPSEIAGTRLISKEMTQNVTFQVNPTHGKLCW